jgi:uncharacterized ion transporter superfamily protein YfcC
VYERDADRCLQALVTMGVLVPTGDTLAVKRTAQFFLNSFQVREGRAALVRCGLGLVL